MSELEENHEETLNILKELITEVRVLNQRVQALETENNNLTKAIGDPETLMKKNGWKKFTTPHADETYDPLNREVPNQFSTPFAGSGDLFLKSRDEVLKEWQDAERQVKAQ
jgi:regulator of replication initiation timing